MAENCTLPALLSTKQFRRANGIRGCPLMWMPLTPSMPAAQEPRPTDTQAPAGGCRTAARCSAGHTWRSRSVVTHRRLCQPPTSTRLTDSESTPSRQLVSQTSNEQNHIDTIIQAHSHHWDPSHPTTAPSTASSVRHRTTATRTRERHERRHNSLQGPRPDGPIEGPFGQGPRAHTPPPYVASTTEGPTRPF